MSSLLNCVVLCFYWGPAFSSVKIRSLKSSYFFPVRRLLKKHIIIVCNFMDFAFI